MPRVVTVALPSDRTEDLVGELQAIEGLLALRVFPGGSRQPPGDVVDAEMTDRCLPTMMHVIDRYVRAAGSGVSVTMSEPTGMVTTPGSDALARDPASSTLEEMEFMMAREATMGLNKMLVMAISGAMAVVGVATDSLHIVIAAMVIAPGFEPLMRLALATVANRRVWWRGASDTGKGYGALVVGAGLAGLFLPVVGVAVPVGEGGYLAAGALAAYWGGVSVSATLVTVLGGLAGALLVAASRSVLTAGVMIALALVPAAALTGVGVVVGDFSMAGAAALRWLHDAAIVFVCGVAVLGGKRAHRRRGLSS
ncbi:DUF389 domain-containing protein [Solwaraspora sp. WMMD791]|uniref:DUF389 domain-containing protein n=1 Tax=Solwaraspora sp. WMMD791 TaxID=3016086 RepID=UPI00249BFB4A|nr:DUF389 domain-containing protein [Solwaraspora sp. WMMD791]WFE26055.1 DUF389 domain-containing protein [Solwaraspora sp. WMMD791]